MSDVDVRSFGAQGDGSALDHEAFNRAIAAAAAAGSGRVVVPAGRYLCFSIRLRSRVTLALGEGSVIVAADPDRHAGRYDDFEPNPHGHYQDFGHSHWRNSLICGDEIVDAAIVGPGMIDGAGPTRDGPGAPWRGPGSHPRSMAEMSDAAMAALEPPAVAMARRGNKAIALKLARRIRLADLTIRDGGHFAVLATGCDDLTIERLMIDTNRDGIDIDCCRRVRITGCRVNSPNDDAIVLKTSLALGERLPTEDVLIAGCTVSGYDAGTALDGSFGRTQQLSPDRDRVTGRIKIGTETNGDVRRVTIRDCRFERSRGLAIETVDGGTVEQIDVRGLVMREVTSAPLFLRAGDRRRGPPGTGLGAIRDVSIRDVDASGIDPRYPATIAGLVDSPVADVTLSNIRLDVLGGGVLGGVPGTVPEARAAYPEPNMFGPLPAYGLYVRHARGIHVDGLAISTRTFEARPPVWIEASSDTHVERLTVNGDAAPHTD